MSDGAPKRIGPWTIHDKLGSGGNATVWRATKDGMSESCALKVLNTTKSGREPYRRFVREIGFLRSIGTFGGVLPLIDAHLPESPTSADRAWLAMPVATLMPQALAEASLETVVAALFEVAGTLARLQAEHEVAHRDIKPENLYELEGRYLVGDFGLVTTPDASDLTPSSKPVGPLHFAAYEMLQDPADADPFPADVYSFGKSLWVVATGQRFPPEGHQPAGSRGFSIGDFRPHTHADQLDRLVDRATRLHPEERPSMSEIARDLDAWQSLSLEPVVIDVSDIRSRLQAKMRNELAEEDLQESRKEQALASVRRVQELTRPLNDGLRAIHPRAELDVADDKLAQSLLRSESYWGSPEIVFRWQRSTRIGAGDPLRRYMLRMGRSLELAETGDLTFRTLVDVGLDGVLQTDFHWQSSDRTAPVGSVAAEKMLEEGIAELAEQLRAALDVFVDHAPSDA